MRVETRQLLEKSTIYSIGNILTKMIAFFLIPLYARKLEPEEYGILAILELVEILGRTILTLGLGQSILRFINQYESKQEKGRLVFSVYFFLLGVNILVLGFIYVNPNFLVTHLLNFSPENVLYFRYTLIVIFSAVFQVIFFLILQAEERALQFIIFSIRIFVSIIGLNITRSVISSRVCWARSNQNCLLI